jgi:O-antigen/teichoic acid export membrane protein
MPEPGKPAKQQGSNLKALALIQIFRLVSGFAINVMLMRGLGVEGFGVYGYVMILVGLAAFGTSMGMDRLIKREIARAPERSNHYISTGLLATLLLSVLTFLFIMGWVWVADGRLTVAIAAGLATVATTLRTLTLIPVAAFHGVRRMGLGVMGEGVGRTVLVAATAVFIYLGFGVVWVFLAQVLDTAVTFAIMMWKYRKHISGARFDTNWKSIVEVVRGAVPFGLNNLFVSIYLSVDVLMIGHFQGDHEVGLYRGSVMLLSLFPIVADTISTGIYPKMARHLGDKEAAGQELHQATRVLLAFSVPAAVGGVLVAYPLLVFLGGEAYGSSAVLFAIMVPLLPLRFLDNCYGMVLQTLNRPGDQTKGSLLASVVNVIANLLLIPKFGAMAAACNTLLTEVVLLSFLSWRVAPLVVRPNLLRTLIRVGVPAACMAVTIHFLPEWHVIITIAVGGAVYAVLGYATGAWRPRDLRYLKKV